METIKSERERQLRDWLASSYYRRFNELAEEVGISTGTLHRFFAGHSLQHQTLDRLERHRAKREIVTSTSPGEN